MLNRWRGTCAWLTGWLVLAVVGSYVIVRLDIAQRREAFRADARIAHRLLSQRVAQHEAILGTLALLQPATSPADAAEMRLPALYPQIISVLRRDGDGAWSGGAVDVRASSESTSTSTSTSNMIAAEARSRRSHRPELGPVDVAAGQFLLVLASAPSSFAIRIDAQRMVPWDEWPVERSGPVRVTLSLADSAMALQPGFPPALQPVGLTAGFIFSEPLSSASQPFLLTLQRATGPVQWPWPWLTAWLLSTAIIVAALAARQRGRRKQRRAEELLRLGQVARLGTLGELAAGMAHEMNQPLAALLANTQAARRMLADEPPELDEVRRAMDNAAAQARRAADVVSRLRRLIAAPDVASAPQPLPLAEAARDMLDLMAPQLASRRIDAVVEGEGAWALADPTAVEQIIHNLVTNAIHALSEVTDAERRLVLSVRTGAAKDSIEHTDANARAEDTVTLSVVDNGPGLSADAMSHLFEPFHTSRPGGLGLGLSLSHTLAQSMNGNLTAANLTPGGAEFKLTLPASKKPA